MQKISQNEEIKNMSELKPRITENGIDYILVGDYYIPDLRQVPYLQIQWLVDIARGSAKRLKSNERRH